MLPPHARLILCAFVSILQEGARGFGALQGTDEMLNEQAEARLARAGGVEKTKASHRDRKVFPHEDTNEGCGQWAEDGECAKNPAYMQDACKYSCAPAELQVVESPTNGTAGIFVNGTQICPIRIEGKTRGLHGAGSAILKINNTQMRNLELLWYDGRSEKRYWVIDARGSFEIQTRAGDRWRLRMKSGELAAEIRVGDATRQQYAIPPCLPPSQMDEAVAAAAYDVVPPLLDELEQCAPWGHLSETQPSPGMHVVCILNRSMPEGLQTELAVYADGWTGGVRTSRSSSGGGGGGGDGASGSAVERAGPSHSFRLPNSTALLGGGGHSASKGWWAALLGGDSEVSDIEAIAYFIMRRLHTPSRGPQHNAPGVYLPSGRRLHTAAEVLSAPCVLVFEGGMWTWPAGEVGRVHELQIDDGAHVRNVSLTTMSLFPRVLLASNFLTDSEAELIISRADGHMFKSGVSLKAADAGKSSSDYRTSSQWSFPLWDRQILALDRRVQQLTRIPMTHAEQIQVLRYQPWEHYTAHHGELTKASLVKASLRLFHQPCP